MIRPAEGLSWYQSDDPILAAHLRTVHWRRPPDEDLYTSGS
jgi:hypothetical protein